MSQPRSSPLRRRRTPPRCSASLPEPVSGAKPFGRTELRALLASHGITPKRSRGQNFLVDPNMAERIARLGQIGPGDRALEIGAGVGSLTLALAATGADITAIEVDERLAELLLGIAPDNVRVVARRDAARLGFAAVESTMDACRQPPLQPGDAAHHRPSRAGSARLAHVRHGASRGRGAPCSEGRGRRLRGSFRPRFILRYSTRRFAGATRRLPPTAERRVGGRRDQAPAGAGCAARAGDL